MTNGMERFDAQAAKGEKMRNGLRVLCCLLLWLGAAGVAARGQIEVGLGAAVPRLADAGLGGLTLAPRLNVQLGVLGLGVDAWWSASGTQFVLMPFLQLRIALLGAGIYGGVAPLFWGGPGGITPISPLLGFAGKLGGLVTLFDPLRAFGEAVVGITPLMPSPLSSLTVLVGVGYAF